MKKFLLSLLLLSTSPVFTSDVAALREQIQMLKDFASLDKDLASSHKAINPRVTNPVEGFIIAHPWYSVVGVAVCTFVAIKAWDYASKSNKDNEDSGFGN